MAYYSEIKIQDFVVSSQSYNFPSLGYGTGASHLQVSSFNTQLGYGVGGQGGGGQNGGSGTVNTGGGGGGAGAQAAGGAGGSGIVIIRYYGLTIKASGGIITNANGYTIHKFTSSGTFTYTA